MLRTPSSLSSNPLLRLLSRAGDVLLPQRCIGCGEAVDAAGLCTTCWSGLAFLSGGCRRCGQPLAWGDAMEGDAPPPPGTLCGQCLSDPPAFDRARAALTYDEASRGLILKFKHSDRLDAAVPFARWMARAGAELLEEADILAPVPLHRWRLFKRRFNQSAVLALGIGRISGVAVVPDLLMRVRATPSQGEFGRLGRQRNVAGAFRPNPKHVACIKGAAVVIVDDVHTTGATTGECARVLKRAGARSVDVLTLARVVEYDL